MESRLQGNLAVVVRLFYQANVLKLNHSQTLYPPAITVWINPLASLNTSCEIYRFTTLVDMPTKNLYSYPQSQDDDKFTYF